MNSRPQILIACNKHVREQYLAATDFARLEAFADWDWFECEGGGIYDTNADPRNRPCARRAAERLRRLGRLPRLPHYRCRNLGSRPPT